MHRVRVRPSSTGVRALLLIAAAVTVAGCAFPGWIRPNTGVKRYVAALPSDAGPEGPIVDSAAVELRSYSFSPHLEILSWTTNDADIGLRAVLRRDGSLVRDHRLYVSTYSSVAAGSRFNLALASTRQLKLTGISRDPKACAGGKACTPSETFGARIPDELLRSNRDGLPVKFYARDGHEVQVTLHRDLINVYLTTVDSITSSLRRK